jgi:hypothetical protein
VPVEGLRHGHRLPRPRHPVVAAPRTQYEITTAHAQSHTRNRTRTIAQRLMCACACA